MERVPKALQPPLPVLFEWYGNADVVEQQVNEMREMTFAYAKTIAKMECIWLGMKSLRF